VSNIWDKEDGSTADSGDQKPTNRKKIQRIYREIGWIVPKMSKSDILKQKAAKLFKPSGPNHLWQTDIAYVHCGVDGWRCRSSVLDAFAREWLYYKFEVSATTKHMFRSTSFWPNSRHENVSPTRMQA